MVKSIAATLVVGFFFAVAVVSANPEEPTLGVSIRIASQDSPVQVVGLRKPQKPSHDPMVHLRNTSSKQTSRIWIEAIIAGRDGKVARINSNFPNERWPEERSIPPGSDGWAHETVLQSTRLLTSGKDLHSNCFRVTVLVLSVEFADGSSWNRNQDQKGVSWTYPAGQDMEDPCKDPTANESDVAQITGAGFRPSFDRKANSDGEEVEAYTFSCHLTHRGETVIAMCPF